MKKTKTYLVCPLNWGLGHASRMIPIIYELLKEEHQVIIGGDGDALKLLLQSFPKQKSVWIKDIKVRFSNRWRILNLCSLIPKIIVNSVHEHYALKRLLKKYNIDAIISDNRYGLWNKEIKSIFVTHQLMVKLPAQFKLLEYPIHLIIKKAISFYDNCWVPDYERKEDSLTGDLTRKYPVPSNVTFIGPLSRFKYITETLDDKNYHIVATLSGPEPVRSNFEKTLISKLKESKKSCLIIQGKPQNKIIFHNKGNVTIVSHLPASKIKYHLKTAKYIICRSGYSSVMDLNYLEKSAILVPTPGQTEQEYLAYFLGKKHRTYKQYSLIDKAITEIFT